MRGTKGCLIIHGFGGSVKEISPLADELKDGGYTVICPVLAGHTGNRQGLRGITYKDWISSAEEGLAELLTACEQVYLIGFSMGGLIAFNLASKYKVQGVVTLNSPIYYWDIKRIILNIIEDIRERKYDNLKHYLSSGSSFPISALFNFRVLLSKSKPILKKVDCPLFIAQALEDDTVRKSSARYIFEHAASQNKYIQYYNDSGHLILWSKASAQVIKDVQDFLKNI